MARLRPTLTLVRRAVGGAAVLFLLGCAVVFYREAPSFSSFRSSPSTTAAAPASPAPTGGGTQQATPGGPSSSADPSQAPSTTPTSDGDSTGSGPKAKEAIQLSDPRTPPSPSRPFRSAVPTAAPPAPCCGLSGGREAPGRPSRCPPRPTGPVGSPPMSNWDGRAGTGFACWIPSPA